MSRRAPVIGGIILIGLGAVFLAREIVPGFELGRLWPVASVVLGVALVILSIRPGRARD